MITKHQGQRKVIPRWRSPLDALMANEARAINATDTSEPPAPRPDLLEREGEWLLQGTRGVGLDLVSVAATSAIPSPVAKEAAQVLLDEGSLSRMARRTAERVVHPVTDAPQFDFPPEEEDEKDHARLEVRRLRSALRDDPRNALAWAEQARMYIQVGQVDPARQAMKRALALAPNHRYVLRAAARLAIHLDEADRAHRLLLATPRTQSDPWLAATEIAVSGYSGRSSRLIRGARLLLVRGDWALGHVTELASALGTAELEAGRSGRARDLFLTSLEVPNDNALAQAESVSTDVPRVEDRLRVVLDEVPRSYEARSLAAASAGDHAAAVNETRLWLADQPFSVDPAGVGSYQAAELMDFEQSLDFARRGLIANPSDLILKNNAAFAMAKLDRAEEATMRLHGVDVARLETEEQAMILATRGLIAFRKGDADLGQNLYLEAIERATSSETRVMAMIMLVSEMMRLRLPGAQQEAEKVRERAAGTLRHSDQDWLKYIDSP